MTASPRLRQARSALEAVKRGYAYVYQNERGRYFSEGEWDILGPPKTDGYDALTWIAEQPWSNGKVGTIGCSSTAEWQMGLAALDHPAHAAMIPQGFGAGVGRVGPFYEQGNWYRGGAEQMLFFAWLYGVQNTQRPMFPKDISREDMVRLSRYFDLAPEMPPRGLVQGAVALARRGHPEKRRRAEGHLRRSGAGCHRGPNDSESPQRPSVVQGRPLS